jgi:hypothetical protein
MQSETITISPRNLTDREIVRLADHYIHPNGLPIEWQKELLNRLAEHTKY